LDRNVKNRLRDIGEARIAIANADKIAAVTADPGTAPVRSKPLSWIVAAAVLAALAVIAAFGWSRAVKPVDRPLMRFTNDFGDDIFFNSASGPAIAISPDGLRAAYISRGSDNQTHLYVRLLANSKSTVLSGADGAPGSAPFFSPDGQWIAFFSENKLKKISIEGGAAVTLCSVGSLAPRGGFWGEDNNILFATQQSPLMRVPSAGGTPVAATQLDTAKMEITNRF